MTEDDEKALIAAMDFASKEAGMPESLWYPDYGWVLWQGEPTETFQLFYEEVFLRTKK